MDAEENEASGWVLALGVLLLLLLAGAGVLFVYQARAQSQVRLTFEQRRRIELLRASELSQQRDAQGAALADEALELPEEQVPAEETSAASEK